MLIAQVYINSANNHIAYNNLAQAFRALEQGLDCYPGNGMLLNSITIVLEGLYLRAFNEKR